MILQNQKAARAGSFLILAINYFTGVGLGSRLGA